MLMIHFRYFKNKIAYKIYLENLIIVITNLFIGIDFEVPYEIGGADGNRVNKIRDLIS